MIHLITSYVGDEIIILGVFEGPKIEFELELRKWLSGKGMEGSDPPTLRQFLEHVGFKELEYESHAAHMFKGLDE